jgi:hypothetical protein
MIRRRSLSNPDHRNGETRPVAVCFLSGRTNRLRRLFPGWCTRLRHQSLPIKRTHGTTGAMPVRSGPLAQPQFERTADRPDTRVLQYREDVEQCCVPVRSGQTDHRTTGPLQWSPTQEHLYRKGQDNGCLGLVQRGQTGERPNQQTEGRGNSMGPVRPADWLRPRAWAREGFMVMAPRRVELTPRRRIWEPSPQSQQPALTQRLTTTHSERLTPKPGVNGACSPCFEPDFSTESETRMGREGVPLPTEIRTSPPPGQSSYNP